MGTAWVADPARLVLLIGPALAAGWVLRGRIAPSWRGAEGALVAIVLGLAILDLDAHVVGALDRFEAGPLALAGIVSLAMVFLVPRRHHEISERPRPARAPGVWLTVVGLAVVTGQWATRVWDALFHGVTDYDSLHYHLPHAARFVQLGSLTQLHFVSADGVPNMFHPSDPDMLHAIGMLAFGSDVISPFLNLGWAAIGVLAAWCIGARWGAGHVSVLGFAVVLAMPMTAISAGSALSDVPSYACLLAAIALLLQHREDPRMATALGGVAAGLALSSKLTMLAPVGVLTLCVLWAWRGRRDRLAGWVAWCAPLLATGSFWYLRNIAAAGSPLPSLTLPGLPHARFESVERYGFSVASYLDDPEILRHWFLPGLATGMTPAWPLVGAVVLATLVVALRQRALGPMRAVAIVAIATIATYVVTPTTALGFPDQPVFFALNLRYMFPALVLVLAVTPIVAGATNRGLAWAVPGAFLAMVAISQLGGRTPPPGFSAGVPAWNTQHMAIGLAAVAGVVLGAVLLLRPGPAARMPSLLSPTRLDRGTRRAALAVLVVLAGLAVVLLGDRYETRYLTHRYADDPIAQALDAAAPTRVALAGFDIQYPFYGTDLDSVVQYVGEKTAHGGFEDVATCPQWRAAITRGAYEYVVVQEQPGPAGPRTEWTATWPAATEVLRAGGRVLYEVDATSADGTCS